MSRATACDACLRRTWLLGRLAAHIELDWRSRRPLREVLALDDEALLRGLCGADAPALRHAMRRTVPDVLRDRTRAAGLVAVCRHDPVYPARLLDDRSAPAVLHVAASPGAGTDQLTELLGAADRPPAVAIVGTRRASSEGLEVARSLGRGLAAAGVTVVSGMALGIDSAAHAGAMDAGGRTVAVLAGGADVAYPFRKRGLYDEIRRAGAVVSEMPPGFRARRWCFPARNRTIAALGDATLVVEAAERSGSLITAEMALELGRDVGAVPGPVLSWRSAGTNALLRDGATVVRDARDALDLVLGAEAPAAAARVLAGVPPTPADLPAGLRSLLDAVRDGRCTVAELGARPADAARVRAGLAELELLGLVRRGPAGRWHGTRTTLG